MSRIRELVKKLLQIVCRTWNKIRLKIMNLTEKEETMLEKIKMEAKNSVSCIIVMDSEEKNERELLKEKLRKDQEIIQRLEEVKAKESF